MRFLVTGAAGHLGAAVVKELRQAHEVAAEAHATLDITDRAAVEAGVARVLPDVIVNCAAYNDVDDAEANPLTALAVNALAVRALAAAATTIGAVFVHYSTDFVFDGEAARPYMETDQPNPQAVYAASKLLGEWFVRDVPRHYVLRVESIFGGPTAGQSARAGSLGGIAARILADEEVPVFTDRTVSPSYAPDIARATRALVEREAPSGLYHCVNTGHGTWMEIAAELARQLGRPARLRPITLDTVALRAARPRFCALSNQKLTGAGVDMPAWRDAVARYARVVNRRRG